MCNECRRLLNNAYLFHTSNVIISKAFAVSSQCLCNCSLTLISLQTDDESKQKGWDQYDKCEGKEMLVLGDARVARVSGKESCVLKLYWGSLEGVNNMNVGGRDAIQRYKICERWCLINGWQRWYELVWCRGEDLVVVGGSSLEGGTKLVQRHIFSPFNYLSMLSGQ